jgi:hypothetical protein
MPEHPTHTESRPYNPALDEPESTRPHACQYELRRRRPEFQKDVKLWCETWRSHEELAKAWRSMDAEARKGTRGKTITNLASEHADTLFAIRHGALRDIAWRGSPLSQYLHATPPFQPSPEDLKRMTACRAWKRDTTILCMLKWMLPAKSVEIRPPVDLVTFLNEAPPDEYQPELSPSEFEEHEKFGPVTLDQPWPKTSPFFRKEFISSINPGLTKGALMEVDLHKCVRSLLTVAELIPHENSPLSSSTIEGLREARQAIQAFALGPMTELANQNKCFLVPAGGIQSRRRIEAMLQAIRAKIPIYDERAFRKASFLGRANQWEAFLIAESLPRVNGHLDFYGTAKLLQARKHGAAIKNLTLSRLARQIEKDVRDRCRAIEHWIGCVYPVFDPKPYVSRLRRP